MRQKITLLDGAMGTLLQRAGLKLGDRPETLSITAPDVVEEIQRQYVQAGANVILANTFCANARKLAGTGFAVEEVVAASVAAARRACAGTDAIVALDVGPIGELLEPLGTLRFEAAFELFGQMIRAGVRAGVQAVFFETFSDLNELRAGVLAAKACCALPIYACMTFEASGRTFLGCRADAAAMALEALGVDAVGVNCSLGPGEVAPILRAMRTCTDLPLILKPNAGLPDPVTGDYSVQPEDFARACAVQTDIGAAYIGGCCGTTPAFIAALYGTLADREAVWSGKTVHGVCSAGEVCAFGQGVRVVGECINPTGKAGLAHALREGDMGVVAALAVEQAEAGARILDVNVGLPGIDEAETMRRAVTAISGVVSLPLQIDSSDPAVIEAGLRAAPGKCLINSVCATEESLAAVLPIARRYGAAIVGLTLGKDGLPATAQERVNLARRIFDAAVDAGIGREDIVIDCLTLTVSAQQEQAHCTLEAVRRVREELGVETMLGVSNISYGLPQRERVTRAFLTQAIAFGLTLPIVNPNQRAIMDAIDACRALSGEDAGCVAYVAAHAPDGQEGPQDEREEGVTLEEAISRGLKTRAAACAQALLGQMEPLELVESRLIPALDAVGERYERRQIFLPQLMSAAAACGAAFDQARSALAKRGEREVGKGPVVLATVEGDIHDIGKNIVRMVLENYGFRVIDLGRDVPAQRVVDAVRAHGARLVGLSALMTTTAPGIERTIKALRAAGMDVPVAVGGAVVTAQYAQEIGADYYAGDAKQMADIARRVTGA